MGWIGGVLACVLTLAIQLESVAAQTLTAGAAGWALRFDGVSSFAALRGEMPEWPVTVEMWLQPLDVTDGMGQKVVTWNQYGAVLSKHTVNGGGPVFSIEHNGNKISFAAVDSSGLLQSKGDSPGRLYHWAYVRQNLTDYASYVNGETLYTGRLSAQEATKQLDPLPQHPWLLGGRVQHAGGKWTTDDRAFGGIVDELRWWSTARTAEQLKASMYLPVPKNAPGLASQWSWDQGTGLQDGATFVLGGGDISKAPQWVPSPVPARGRPVAVVARTGSPAQVIDLCVLLSIESSATGMADFQVAPTVGDIVPMSGIQLTRRNSSATDPPNSSLFCGQTRFTPRRAGFEEVDFLVTLVLPDGTALNTTQKVSMRVSTNSAPVAGNSLARRFGGADYGTLGQFDFQDNLTIAFWALPSATGEGNSMVSMHQANGKNLFQFQYQSGGWAFVLKCLGCTGDDTVIFPVEADDALVLNTNKTARQIRATRGDAHHIMVSHSCLSRGGSGAKAKARVVMYLDGEIIGIKENFASCFPKPVLADKYPSSFDRLKLPMPWEIGEEYDAGVSNKHIPGTDVVPSDFFTGIMDDFTFWPVILTAEEAQTAARGQTPRPQDVIARFTFDLDDPSQCEEARLADSRLACGLINEANGRPVASQTYPWSPHIFGDLSLVPSPFNRLPGGPIHAAMQENTCKKMTLTGSDSDGDQLTYSLSGALPKNLTLKGSVLELCAGAGRQDVTVQFDACDPLGLCASGNTGLGTALFHVLKTGPRAIAFQVLPREGALRIVFDAETNMLDLSDRLKVARVFRITGLPAGGDVLLGRWDEGGRSLRLVLAEATTQWLRNQSSSIRGELLQAGGLRDRTSTSYLSAQALPAVQVVDCSTSEWLPPGQVSCIGCSPGFKLVTDGLVGTCVACPQGYYQPQSNMLDCLRCPKGSFSAVEGATTCTSCSHGKVTPGLASTKAADCVCPVDTYEPASGEACVPCISSLFCEEGSTEAALLEAASGTQQVGDVAVPFPKARPGYWSPKESPLTIFKCQSEARCPGGSPETCAFFLQGRSCAHCVENYWWDQDTGSCRECTSAETSRWIFPTIPALVCPTVILVLYFFSKDPLERWGSWQNGAATLLFVLLKHYQVLDLTKGAARQAVGPVVVSLNSWGFTNGFEGIFRVSCAGFERSDRLLAARCLLPACLLGSGLVLYLLSVAVQKLFRRTDMKAFDANRMFNATFSFMFTFFTSIAALSLSLFKCQQNPGGWSTLAHDLAVICFDSDEWKSMLGVGVAAVIVYCIGFGLLFVWAVFRAVTYFSDRGFQTRWKFLFIKFRPDVFWWSLVTMVHMVLVNMGFVIFVRPVAQLYWLMALTMIYAAALVVFMPYTHRLVNFVEMMTSASIIFNTSLLTWFADHADGRDDQAVSMAAAVIGWSPLAVGFFVILLMATRHLQPSSRSRLAKDFADAVVALSVARPDELEEFVGHLGEWDAWHLCVVMDLIRIELMGRKPGSMRLRTDRYTALNGPVRSSFSELNSLTTRSVRTEDKQEGTRVLVTV